MSGCKYPCKYCGKLVFKDDTVCSYCGKVTPVESQLISQTKKPLGTDNDSACCGYCNWRYV